MRFLSAALPTRRTDVDEGKTRLAVYVSILGTFPDEAFVYMSRRACAELEWFPTPKQCLDILAAFKSPLNDRKATAGRYAQDFWQDRFEEFRTKIARRQVSLADLETIPDQWKRILVEQGFLRWTKDDGFFIEARYRNSDAADAIPEIAPEAKAAQVQGDKPREPTAEDYRKMGFSAPPSSEG